MSNRGYKYKKKRLKLLTLGVSSLDVREDLSETMGLKLRTEAWIGSIDINDMNLGMGTVLQGE